MPRKLTGIRRRRGGWRVYVRVRGKLRTKQFPLDTSIDVLKAWRDKQKKQPVALVGSIAADIVTYLARPDVAAMAYVHQYARYLALWVAELGRDRPRASVTRDEIEAILQRWLTTLAPATVYHRRTALLSMYAVLDEDDPDAVNPVLKTTCPAAWTPTDQSVPFATLVAIWHAMPDYRYVKKGIRRPSIAKLVVGIMLHEGVRPVDLWRVRRPDVNLQAATVQMPATTKGHGTASWTLQLTPEGLAVFRAFDAANAYGAFNPEAVSHSYKRAVRRVVGPDSPIHLYSERHSVGADSYRLTRDLDTVGRKLGHAPGSRATAQYARGANADVDRAATAALSAGRAASLPVPEPSQMLPEMLTVTSKTRKRKHLRKVS